MNSIYEKRLAQYKKKIKIQEKLRVELSRASVTRAKKIQRLYEKIDKLKMENKK